MNRRETFRARTVGFEQLEGRELLAADVPGIFQIASATLRTLQANEGIVRRQANGALVEVNSEYRDTAKAYGEATQDNAKDIAADARARNQAALQRDLQDQRDLNAELRQAINDLGFETSRLSNEVFQQNPFLKLRTDLLRAQTDALRQRITPEQFEQKADDLVDLSNVKKNNLTGKINEIVTSHEEKQEGHQADIAEIRDRHGLEGVEGRSIGIFASNPVAVRLPGQNTPETTADLTIELFQKGNKLTARLVRGSWSIYNATSMQNEPAQATSVTLTNATVDANGNVRGKINFGIRFTGGQHGQTTFDLLDARLTDTGFSARLPNSVAEGTLTLTRVQ